MIHVNTGRADPWSGNYLDRERAKSAGTFSCAVNKGRFCESCQSFKPRRGLAFKGWECDDCKGEK